MDSNQIDRVAKHQITGQCVIRSLTFLSNFSCLTTGKTFPTSSIIPKMHFMEVHMIPWLYRSGEMELGFGFMGEQGMESIHHVFNNLHCSYAYMCRSTERLKRIVAEHHLQNSPVNIELQPTTKRNNLQHEK